MAKTKEEKNAYNRQYREAHPDYGKKYREAHPDCDKKYREAHPNQVRECSRLWKENHPDQVRKYGKKYREAHPDRMCKSRRKHICIPKNKLLDLIRSYAFRCLPRRPHLHTKDLVPWNPDDGVEFINSHLPEGFNVVNKGHTYHIHHIIPHTMFNFSEYETDASLLKEFKRFNMLDNLIVLSAGGHQRLHRDMKKNPEKFQHLIKTVKMAIQFEEEILNEAVLIKGGVTPKI